MEKRTAYVRSVDRPVRVEEAVLTQSLAMGMTPKEVEMTFGQPTYVSASAYKGYGRTLQWCYKNYLSGQLRCLYFRSNELVGWN